MFLEVNEMPESSGIDGLPEDAIPIGDVTKFFPKIGVAGVKLRPEAELNVGDEIFFVRKDTDSWDSLVVSSLEKDREKISRATGDDHIGVLIGTPVERRSTIYRRPQSHTNEDSSEMD